MCTRRRIIRLLFGPLADCAVKSPRIARERSRTKSASSENVFNASKSKLFSSRFKQSQTPPIVSSITVATRSKLFSIASKVLTSSGFPLNVRENRFMSNSPFAPSNLGSKSDRASRIVLSSSGHKSSHFATKRASSFPSSVSRNSRSTSSLSSS